jgi:hypothetical protein
MKTHVGVSLNSQPKRPKGPTHWFWDALTGDERESTVGTSVNQQREAIFQPEQFAMLKKGGDGNCEAVVMWVSHPFSCNNGMPFRVIRFEQDCNRI